MKLRRLELHGFKSFADRTELVFHDGITAVVGPNGCGKSNISDAIRWVLGEQRASAIRGTKMDEAIFQGTAERRPVNRAEVALTFSNEDRRLAVPFDEIEIRRTIFREGGSEYELNRAPCRLRDIIDLCRDTGLGALAYAVIEQRMVDGILSDRTDDRRQIFEEAAGVGRYKDRRRAAERRLEAAAGDLERLEDLIGEVESKVRSLARQRRQAQRYHDLRERRRILEVTLAILEGEELEVERNSIERRLAELLETGPATSGVVRQLELDLERNRLAAADTFKARAGIAEQLEEAARQIAESDREIAVVTERRAHAERRLDQIDAERRELATREEGLVREIEELESDHQAQSARVEAIADQLEVARDRQSALREEVVAARVRGEGVREEEAEYNRRIAQAEQTASREEARAAEATARIERLQLEEAELETELRQLHDQGDLFADLTRNLAATRAERLATFEAMVERLAALRLREAEARRACAEAEDLATSISARLSALEGLDRAYHGLAPRTAAVLRDRGQLEGVLGSLAEFLKLPPRRAAAVEDALGSLLQILVVSDLEAAARVRDWIGDEGAPGEGTLAILPHPALPSLVESLDALVMVGEPAAEAVLIGRRERLEALRAESVAANEIWEARREARARAEAEAEQADAELRKAESALQEVEVELARAEAESSSSSGQRSRLERAHAELQRQILESREIATLAHQEALAAREAREALEAELVGYEEEWQAGRTELARLESLWESAREEDAELRVLLAREEASVAELGRRRDAARRGLEELRGRLPLLDREEAEHREALVRLAEAHSAAGTRIEDLFRRRDDLTGELRAVDEGLEATNAEIARLEGELRSHRKAAEGLTEERHRLELRLGQVEATLRGIRERIEVEWGRPFHLLVRETPPLEGERSQLQAELLVVTADLERLGPVNMLAIEEHQEESARLEFLTSQRDDLLRARDELQDAIRRINRQARELFLDTFAQVRLNFHRTFGTLFEGGTCDLALTDPDDPLESDVEISASPYGKRTQRIHLLSGGERALTALSLLFAIYLVKPSPFCVLDEVDAPLDESNIGRFVQMLQEFKRETQFIIITHNPRTIEAADWVYGVTMAEPGVSTMVGVELDPALAGGPH